MGTIRADATTEVTYVGSPAPPGFYRVLTFSYGSFQGCVISVIHSRPSLIDSPTKSGQLVPLMLMKRMEEGHSGERIVRALLWVEKGSRSGKTRFRQMIMRRWSGWIAPCHMLSGYTTATIDTLLRILLSVADPPSWATSLHLIQVLVRQNLKMMTSEE